MWSHQRNGSRGECRFRRGTRGTAEVLVLRVVGPKNTDAIDFDACLSRAIRITEEVSMFDFETGMKFFACMTLTMVLAGCGATATAARPKAIDASGKTTTSSEEDSGRKTHFEVTPYERDAGTDSERLHNVAALVHPMTKRQLREVIVESPPMHGFASGCVFDTRASHHHNAVPEKTDRALSVLSRDATGGEGLLRRRVQERPNPSQMASSL